MEKTQAKEIDAEETLVSSYANVIAQQIRKNFETLDDNKEKCTALEEYLREYKKALGQGTCSEFFLKKDIREYAKNVKKQKHTSGVSFCGYYSEVEPLAIGILGEWGSGKTHLLELIKHDLNYPNLTPNTDETQSDTPKKQASTPLVIPILFNAWRFEKEEHIILPLFETLLSTLDNYERSNSEKIGKTYRVLKLHVMHALASLHYGLKPLKAWEDSKELLTGNLEKALTEAKKIVNTEEVSNEVAKKNNEKIVGDQDVTQMLNPSTLSSIYYNFIQWIANITAVENVHFVFLVDDLDRCLPENTLKMLESIKLFLDVPSCAFVLAVDDDVVERGVMHHYRDYLPKSKKEGYDTAKSAGLPITGHEYLEKIIQLPIRLPVIDIANVIRFLREQSEKGWIPIVQELEERKVTLTESEASSPKDTRLPLKGYTSIKSSLPEEPDVPKQDEVERLLHYLAKHTPPKYRKIKRVSKLFETKLELLKSRGLLESVDLVIVAKLTLLELFAPTLLRYIQSQGYGKVFNRLCLLKEVTYLNDVAKATKKEKEKVEKYSNLLSDYALIETYIEKNFTSDTQLLLTRAMEIVKEHYKSRVYFDLDAMFDEQYSSDTQLKPILELQVVTTTKALQKASTSVASDFYTKLFRDGDVEGWREALTEHNTRIESTLLDEIIKKGTKQKDDSFNSLPFVANPEWVGVVAGYLEEKEYLVLLKASHDARFRTDKKLDFYIDSFQMTFAEYDKYCDLSENKVEKPKDEGWGRGRRPVINVSWKDAKSYIGWLNDKLKRTYALPTEKEWELACNLGKKSMWHFGDDESQLKEYAWYQENSKSKTHRVGSLKPNDIALYDMHGNVWEWCENWFDEKEEKYKSLRGGSWSYSSINSRSAFRLRYNPTDGYSVVGFRLLRTSP